ncbi:MAG: aminoacetone oxidase family FAD-binding enzyme [Rikenellaceae bacterium]|nr:aminoacetone oxidase family FAD-binding enzyme [Rikenellaceae bacterium]
MRTYDVVVVGAGAAGLMAAGTAASQGFRTLLIEKMEKPARKVRITGKGRCNLTNAKPLDQLLEKVRVNRPFAWDFLRFFSNIRTIEFFKKNGLPLITERGDRVFPASGNAGDVANALEKYARKQDAEVECHTSAVRLETENGQIASITVRNKKQRLETIRTDHVIIATGGVSYPATGSTGDGYTLAHALGHRIVEVRPSLVPLEIETAPDEELAGLFLKNVALSLKIDGKTEAKEFGEIDFFDHGIIGGAVILRISRDAVDALIDEKTVMIELDLKSALSPEQLLARIDRELSQLEEGAPLRDLLRKLVPMKLVLPLAKRAGMKPTDPAQQLTQEGKATLVDRLKHYRFTVTDYRPFEEAIVTAGGVDVTQVDSATMQSTLIKGLYFAGEVLDVDANTGGYNLQLAFSSGRLAGMLKK